METAEYVAAMSDELAHLSRSVGLDVVAYLLEMARFEAGLQARER